MNSSEQILPPAYFGSLTIENVKCFKGKHKIDLSNKNDKNKPAMWTVILGNNNTGKTTLLRCLADLESTIVNYDNRLVSFPKQFIKLRELSKTKEKNLFLLPNTCIKSIILLEINESIIKLNWGYEKGRFECLIEGKNDTSNNDFLMSNLIVYGYGTSRRMGNKSLSETENQDNTETLFNEVATLINVEDWLIRVYAVKDLQPKAKETLEKIKKILISGILPDVKDFDFDADDNSIPFVKCKTDYGWVKLRELGYGYQTTLAWVVDLAKKMFERYPNSENPLHQPAIVLVDEIDLHLHPEWQRKIIQFLKKQFRNTQFIVTTHSPLIIQSMDDINLVLLEKEDDHVIIKQPDLKNYQGWTVEEILSDRMGLEGQTLSKIYTDLVKKFNKAIAKNNYNDAKQAYDELDELLHPNNIHRELLSLQLNSLSPETA